MTEWAARRFWTAAHAVPAQGGHAVHLDDRPVRTPAKAPLVLPTRAMAEAVAREWDAQGETIDPGSMPVTRAANAAIDKVAPQHGAVADGMAAYGATDLLCYRAVSPPGLALRQAEAWDPLLDWADGTFRARLRVTAGVMPVAQDPAALAALAAPVHAMGPFALAGFHDLTMLSGSLVIALASAADVAPPETLWEASRIDEVWQAEQWGRDDEAEAAAAVRRAAFLDARRILGLAMTPD